MHDKVSAVRRDTVISQMTGQGMGSILTPGNNTAGHTANNTPGHRREKSNMSISIGASKQQGEKEFFKLVVLSVLLSSPSFMIEQLVNKDPNEMYKRAKANGISF